MKKLLIYRWLPCLLAIFMCTTFTACSSDDNETILPINKESLEGLWFMVEGNGALYFSEGETGYVSDNRNNDAATDYMKYKLVGDDLYFDIIRFNSGYHCYYKIVSITSSTLTLKTINYSEEDEEIEIYTREHR